MYPTLIQVANLLEEHTINLITLHAIRDPLKLSNGSSDDKFKTSPVSSKLITSLQLFYRQPQIVTKRKHLSNISLSYQLSQQQSSSSKNKNNYSVLYLEDEAPTNPEDTSLPLHCSMSSSLAPSKTPTLKWTADSAITKLSESILKDLQVDADKMQEEGEDTEHLPQYQHNPQGPSSEVKVNQHIRFNLIRHRNSDSSIPTLKLFKSFRTALRSADQFLLALPVNSAKQNLPALSNLTQINNTDKNKMFTYFKPYFTKQMYSLSGYFHVSSSMSLQELMASSTIYEWLEINRYTIKQSPSNAEEMVRVLVVNISTKKTSKWLSLSTPSGPFPLYRNHQSYTLPKETSEDPRRVQK